MFRDHADPLHARRSLFVMSLAAAGTLGGLLLHSAPPPATEIPCVLPSIDEGPIEGPIEGPDKGPIDEGRRDVPPADSAPSVQGIAHRTVVADLVSRGPDMPGCGTLLVETPMVFADVFADGATLRVLVPCAEMPRPTYSPSAGNAPVLQQQLRYRLELSGPVVGDRAGKNDALWRADRIDVVASSRPAIADVMCRDVWPPGCIRRKTTSPYPKRVPAP